MNVMAVHKALQKKQNREASESFVKDIEAKVREMAYEDAKQEALKYWHERIEHCLLQDYHYMLLMVLHDKDGFGQDRGIDRLLAIETLLSDIGDGRLTKEDVREVVQTEMKIAVEEDGIYRLKKNGERELAIKFNYEGVITCQSSKKTKKRRNT